MEDPRPEGAGPACGARAPVYTPREAVPGVRPLFHAALTSKPTPFTIYTEDLPELVCS